MNELYNEEFLKRLRENLNLKKQRQVFEAILGPAKWEILPADVNTKQLLSSGVFNKCPYNKEGKDIKFITDIAGFSRQAGVQKFLCEGKNGFCMPLKQGNQIYGYIIMCGFTKQINEELLAIFTAFTETVMREVQKEMELVKLYDTIRPRAIALSTIHTVHRLMHSTLSVDELIPKIARLCLQLMRVESCYIYLLEGQGGKLAIKGAVKAAQDTQIKSPYVKISGNLARIINTCTSILKPRQILAPLIDEDVVGIIRVENKLGERPFVEFDKEILVTFAEQAVIAIKNIQLYEGQERITLGVIKSLAAILDSRTQNITVSSMDFSNLTIEIAKELGMPLADMAMLRYASLLHDAGKIMIPDKILAKDKRLTEEEYRIVKEHTINGVKVLKPIEALRPAIPIILHHHERYDGAGYPEGLKGEEIPLGSRIMAVVDAFVSMVSKQPYRERLTAQEAIAEIKRYSHTQFDPKVTDAFVKVFKKMDTRLLRKFNQRLKG